MEETTPLSFPMKCLQDSKFYLSSSFRVAGLVLFSIVFLLGLLQLGMIENYNTLNVMESVISASKNINPVKHSESHSFHSTVRDSSTSRDHVDCLSREQHMLLRPAFQMIPSSPGLEAALTAYEKRHAECYKTFGRNWTEPFLRSLNGSSIDNPNDCQFLIFIETEVGLGNRLISLVSAAAFALFTNRILLVDSDSFAAHVLLCEPFSDSSWALTVDFPERQVWLDAPDLPKAMEDDFLGVGNVLYLNLDHTMNSDDQKFFCHQTREFIQKIDWITWGSNFYFLPRLLTFPEFWPQLSTLFPNPSHAFTHLSRYFLLPNNRLWDRILRIYFSYLSSPGKLVGVQIRRNAVADEGEFSALALERVMHCLIAHDILPNTSSNAESFPKEPLLEWPSHSSGENVHKMQPELEIGGPNVTSVLIASLQQRFGDEIQELYTKFPTVDGSLVKVHMFSHERKEIRNDDQFEKAFVEMWLLSFSDILATSSWSTFGYVAHGLGGLRPYIMNLRGELDKNYPNPLQDPANPNLHCVVGPSPEPCDQRSLWPKWDCSNETIRTAAHEAWIERHLAYCLDEHEGVQLVSNFTIN